MLTDTHTHLADPILAQQLPHVLQHAQLAGVHRFIVPATQHEDWQAVLQLSATHILPALGIHPWLVAQHTTTHLTELEALVAQYPHILIGEIGLDYSHATTPEARQQQQQWFTAQLMLAQHHQRPIILHNVRATNDMVRLLKQARFSYGGFAHAFSGSLEEARSLIDLGFKIGIGVLLLNPRAKKTRRAATELPLEHLVLETDSPFMQAKHSNRPAHIHQIAETLAQLRHIPLAQIAQQTENNVAAVLNMVLPPMAKFPTAKDE